MFICLGDGSLAWSWTWRYKDVDWFIVDEYFNIYWLCDVDDILCFKNVKVFCHGSPCIPCFQVS